MGKKTEIHYSKDIKTILNPEQGKIKKVINITSLTIACLLHQYDDMGAKLRAKEESIRTWHTINEFHRTQLGPCGSNGNNYGVDLPSNPRILKIRNCKSNKIIAIGAI